MTAEALRLARIVWDYHQLGQEPVPGDAIVALGTNDLRVAEFAADLWHRGYGPVLIPTGGIAHQGDLLETRWTKTEAAMYADVAEARGVPRGSILLEPRARNTSENLRFTRELLRERGMPAERIVIAVKPFMQRRVHATLAQEWPGVSATIASPGMTLEEYFTAELTPDRIVNIMTGDLQRLAVYGRRGWSAPQVMPAGVLDAYRGLVRLGYTGHLLPDEDPWLAEWPPSGARGAYPAQDPR